MSMSFNNQNERFEFFSELFKVFLSDINPAMLNAFKVSYKYSRVKTSEFEAEMIEIISSKENLTGKEYLRELVNELNNVAEVYQLLEEQSPLSQHLYELEEKVEKLGRMGSKEFIECQMELQLKEPSGGMAPETPPARFGTQNEFD